MKGFGKVTVTVISQEAYREYNTNCIMGVQHKLLWDYNINCVMEIHHKLSKAQCKAQSTKSKLYGSGYNQKLIME